jgi:polyisoprenoid-binding protein YceI
VKPALAAWLGCLLASLPAMAMTRGFDAMHSNAEFSVRTLWLHQITGRIGGLDGRLDIGSNGNARVDVWIDVAQVHMDDSRYLGTVRSADFFDSAKYPRMHFRSKDFDPGLLHAGGALSGWLTLRGKTRQVDFELLPGNCAQPADGPCEIRVRGNLHRSAFGMHAHRFSVSDHVQLRLHIALAPAGQP